ncbi:MAG: hypothetical protein OEQ13_11215 [Acidobacteriota bacterium]|nr:hypothetical protein [Acidobacteriota bacterium]
MARSLLALVLVLALAGMPLALAAPCADATAGSCCCEKPADDCSFASQADCGCVMESGQTPAPLPVSAASVDSRTPLVTSALPVSNLRPGGSGPSPSTVVALAVSHASLRLHVRYGVFLC